MNQYAASRQRQQEESDSFPMRFAFSDRQPAEGMAELGLEPTDTDKICKAPGGGFIYDMFLYELENHEYGCTREIGDALGHALADIHAEGASPTALKRPCRRPG